MTTQPDKKNSWKMFDKIHHKYDFLNHLLSFGLDIIWRKRLIKYLKQTQNLKILDCATGTGDVLITFCKKLKNIDICYGIDLAQKMLDVGREKILDEKLNQKIVLKHADATHLPFENDTFDNTTISFGIRNIPDPQKALEEMHRVLKPEGRAVVLEFGIPKNKLIKAVHIFYLRTIVPIIGGWISKDKEAYRYLNQTIEEFPYGDDFVALMKAAGFSRCEFHPLLFGTAMIYVGEK